jgi:hypothetical protein
VLGGERGLPDAGGVADFHAFDAYKGHALGRLHLSWRQEEREEERAKVK